jgi:hypothetical protein
MYKLIKIAAIFFICSLLFSCEEKGKIRVENLLKKVTIKNINWGEHNVSESLLPGQTSSYLTINDSYDDYNKSFPIDFVMSNGNISVYLKTKTQYIVGKDDDITVTISDSSEVENTVK